ncbi:hypothetical protein M501DRAFT_986357 [Patellaria atrata CBS 101060]|uniref:Uncharacterized protein n=1 Tax=Patellaria atrata CBS 101060 TaxID=1346257 RepID=A0A9P4S7H9_9PEZI|nr:hypothetical protein M501DRAFT_986357 [Patellaria atrata CBS 101060]
MTGTTKGYEKYEIIHAPNKKGIAITIFNASDPKGARAPYEATSPATYDEKALQSPVCDKKEDELPVEQENSNNHKEGTKTDIDDKKEQGGWMRTRKNSGRREFRNPRVSSILSSVK